MSTGAGSADRRMPRVRPRHGALVLFPAGLAFALVLLPLLGLIAPGAWEQDPSTIGITLEPDKPQPATTP